MKNRIICFYKEKIIGFYSLANTITCLALVLSVSCCLFALKGNISPAMTLFILAGICDLFDGAVARKTTRTDLEKAYGVQLDSLADCVSFGIVPCILAYSYGFDAWWSLIFYLIYIVHAVVRLAYFNVVRAEKTPAYLGLPVTYIALLLPIVMLFKNQVATALLFAVMAELFVIKIKVPKPKGVWYALFPLIALGLVIVWWLI